MNSVKGHLQSERPRETGALRACCPNQRRAKPGSPRPVFSARGGYAVTSRRPSSSSLKMTIFAGGPRASVASGGLSNKYTEIHEQGGPRESRTTEGTEAVGEQEQKIATSAEERGVETVRQLSFALFASFCSILSISCASSFPCSPRRSGAKTGFPWCSSSIHAFSIITFSLGDPSLEPRVAMASTTSSPSTTFPKTVCRPSIHGMGLSVMKNWQPSVFRPAFAMERSPALFRRSNGQTGAKADGALLGVARQSRQGRAVQARGRGRLPGHHRRGSDRRVRIERRRDSQAPSSRDGPESAGREVRTPPNKNWLRPCH